jgi:hypothetical protein
MATSGCGEWSRGIKDSPVPKMSAEEAVARENYTRQFQETLAGIHAMCGKIEKRLARAQPEVLESFKEAVTRAGTFHRWLLNEATPDDITAIASIPPETIRLSLESYRRRREQAALGAAARPLEGELPALTKARAKLAKAKDKAARVAKAKKRVGRPPGSKNKPRR